MFLTTIFLYSLASEALVMWLSRMPMRETEFDVILLLGANGNKQSPVTIDRARNATMASQHWPNAKILITGNENSGEVSAYKALLADFGVSTDRFLEETQSQNTWDNVILSKPLLPEGSRVLIVTSEYRQPRALAIARANGIKASAFGRDTRNYQDALYFFFKERLSNMKYFFQILFASLTSH